MQTAMTDRDIMFRRFQIQKFSNKRMVPTVSMTVNVNVSRMIELKKEANNRANINYHITVTHVIMKAVADALIKFPVLYSFFDSSKIIDNSELILNIPVDIENHVEYIVVHTPDSKTLIDISNECANELEKIYKGEGEFTKALSQINSVPLWIRKLSMLDSKATFKFLLKHYGNFPISNFGSLNINNGTLALSQPIIASLCIGAISPAFSKSADGYDCTMNLPISISFDHRAVDGAYSGRFLNEVKKLLESPENFFEIQTL